MKTKLSKLLLLLLLALLANAGHLAAQSIDFGKSYVNLTKGTSGGTVEPGDILEIRASVVVRSGTFDSCAYYDVIPTGTSYIAGTVRVLTNEGKIYKQFTDAVGDDQGWINGVTIRINLGYNGASAPATAFRRGRVANTHKPSFYSNTCIMIASYQVRVTAPYNTTLSLGGGSVTYRPSGGSLSFFSFPARTVAVYQNVGICPNAVGANALGTEFNGTFGTGRPRNRGASANVPVGYTYANFTSGTPNDYFYGVSNNTSINTGYATSNAWPIPDNTRRVFGVWDIIGDHTGAASPTSGNPAADTVANGNAGYMLVINAAYRIDSAFQQTISGLCPNTYYEISVWLRNICSRCGCDSNGRGSGSTGYIPTAPGDSSGVYPNLSFNVDGVDYYTTGNIQYTGQWIKKGFTFRTGPAQNSFTLKVFNNAPGGGGNDWALDDISVATCSPNLAFTPNNNPQVCEGNVVDLGAWIRSYFNNYTYFKWQKSTDNGSSWNDAGPVSNGTPTWNGSNWEFYTAYPSFVASAADSGTKFRVVVASTAANITSSSCAFADATSILTLNVLDCADPLATHLLSFTGAIAAGRAALQWTTDREEGALSFVVERSTNGRDFSTLATLPAYANGALRNTYNWTDPQPLSTTMQYRVRLVSGSKAQFSRVIRLGAITGLSFGPVPNPVHQQLRFELNSPDEQVVHLFLFDSMGKLLVQRIQPLHAGINDLGVDFSSFAKGMYTLQVKSRDIVLTKKLVKEN